MNVLSLFDGMSCGRIALDRAGINVSEYYASEIDKHAIKVAQHNYPDTIQIGDVKEWRDWYLPDIDIVIGGSPCQGFSFSGKQLNFDDPRSKLFFDFVDVLDNVKPRYFLLENVKMKKENQDIISRYLGVEPIEINSSLVSAQNRIRLYWTNIPNVAHPGDKQISLLQILDASNSLNPAAIRGRRLNKGSIVGRRINVSGKREDNNKRIPISQCLEVRAVNTDKSNCLTTVAKDNVLTSLPVGRYPDAFKRGLPFRYYTVDECCRLQTVPVGYFGGVVSNNQALKMLGNGWTVDVIAHILRGARESSG